MAFQTVSFLSISSLATGKITMIYKVPVSECPHYKSSSTKHHHSFSYTSCNRVLSNWTNVFFSQASLMSQNCLEQTSGALKIRSCQCSHASFTSSTGTTTWDLSRSRLSHMCQNGNRLRLSVFRLKNYRLKWKEEDLRTWYRTPCIDLAKQSFCCVNVVLYKTGRRD